MSDSEVKTGAFTFGFETLPHLLQIKSNHFYCHITTAQVPWWVKFLWACSRQCRKTTDNLPMDRQCKKTTTDNLHMDRQCKKTTTDNLHMDRQCKKLHWSIYSAPDSAEKQQTIYIWTDSAKKQQQTIYIWTDSAKNCTGAFTVLQTVQKNNRQFTYGQTVQKNNNNNLHMDRQCKKATAIYIWTVHIYRLYRRQCAKYTYIYSVHIVYYKDILNYQRHIIHRMGTSAGL